MNRRLYALGLLGLTACAGGVGNAGARVDTAVAHAPAPAPLAKRAPTSTPLEYHDESDSDRVFVQNAQRAIREYTEFIARAGASPEYARAVQRSREQIQDLEDTLLFVRAGSAERR